MGTVCSGRGLSRISSRNAPRTVPSTRALATARVSESMEAWENSESMEAWENVEGDGGPGSWRGCAVGATTSVHPAMEIRPSTASLLERRCNERREAMRG